MGFGLLFIGYLFTYLLSLTGTQTADYGALAATVGSFIMLYALTRLIEYNRDFRFPFFALIPKAVCALWGGVTVILTLAGVELPAALVGGVFANIVAYAEFAFDLLYHFGLFFAVRSIAKDTGLSKIMRSAECNAVVYGLFFIMQIATQALGNSDAAKYAFIAEFVLSLCWIVLDSVMIFSCYRQICDEDDTEMKPKPSRFAFVNRWRSEFERRENKARENNIAYQKEKLEKRKSKRKK